ncbi:MYXO-CTERM sorting domain-containing protein [Nannocystaceae bacterium ST9]
MDSQLRLTLPALPIAALVYLSTTGLAWAGTITAQGNVTALTNVNQLQGIVGTATYNEANNGGVPLGQYTPSGMTFFTGALTNILAGVMAGGNASQPIYQTGQNYFPAPIAGGGVATGSYTFFGGAVKFTQPVTQFGLTAATNGTQYITVWNTSGTMIGQVTWQPNGDSAFVGVDTNGQPIGMLTYGNDNIWAGAAYDIGGSTIISDTWIWALGVPCQSAADCMDDDNPCTSVQCNAGACSYPPDPQGVCPDDGNMCTDDVCTNGACVHPDNSDPCDDEDACTELDACNQGDCEGVDLECNDANLCSVDSCDSMIGCVFDFQQGCCLTDEDCEPGEVCLIGSNSCIPDPDPTGDGDTTDTTDTTGDGDTTETTTGEGDSTTTDAGDSTTDEGGSESGGDSGTSTGSLDEVGDDASTLDTFGGDETDGGCSCTTDTPTPGRGALFGLLGLGLLGAIRRRRAA